MLYKPLNMQPYLETIDGEIENNFFLSNKCRRWYGGY